LTLDGFVKSPNKQADNLLTLNSSGFLRIHQFPATGNFRDAPQIIRFSHRLMETYILRGAIQIHTDNTAATLDNKDGIYPEPLFE